MYKQVPPSPVNGSNSNQQNPTPQIVHQEFLGGDSSGWLVQWRQRREWKIQTPRLKECKKRKDSYSKKFEPVMYKAPYKYHIHMQSGAMKTTEPVIVQLALNFENGENIALVETPSLSNGSREVKIQKFEKVPNSDELEVTIGPFQFNVCSFRQDGRKFRLVMHLFSSMMNIPTLICSVVSPPFIIRAKKPIKNPGTRKKKRKRDKNSSNTTNKKRKMSKNDSKGKRTTPQLDLQVQQQHQNNILQRKTGNNNNLIVDSSQQQQQSKKKGGLSSSISLSEHIKQQQLVINPQITFNPPPTFSPVGLLNLTPPSILNTRIRTPLLSSVSAPQTLNQIPQNSAIMQQFNSNMNNNHIGSTQRVQVQQGSVQNDQLNSSTMNLSGNIQLPYSNTSQIDMFDFLLSEQEEPEEKHKDLTNRIVSDYSTMNSEKRISLLTRMLEISYPAELEYIRAIFFSDSMKHDLIEDTKTPQVFSDMDKLMDDNYSI